MIHGSCGDTPDCGRIDFSSFQAETGGDGDQAHMEPEHKSPKTHPALFLSLSPFFYFHFPSSLLFTPSPHTLHSSFLCVLSSITLSALHSHFLNSATPPAAFSLCFFYPPPQPHHHLSSPLPFLSPLAS